MSQATREWLAKVSEERYPYRNGETYYEEWRPTDDAVRPVTYGVLRAINAEIARLSEEARALREAVEYSAATMECIRDALNNEGILIPFQLHIEIHRAHAALARAKGGE